MNNEKDIDTLDIEVPEQDDVSLVEEIRDLRANSVSREVYEAEIKKLNSEKRKLARMAIEGEGNKVIEVNENEATVEELAAKLGKANANTMSNLDFVNTMLELEAHGFKFSENRNQNKRVKDELMKMVALSENDPRKLNLILQDIEEPLWHRQEN